ncbi:hypothetical protein ACQPXM_02405 [Kribbella sp. CA-253562]|uniref:hypothetical protein n=1 Tax=Kribbella sp. CA-253562 TaxID=3239942 RepID=UPI003D940E89
MNKSDEELGELLRETFASKENQADSLPAAIKAGTRRRFSPALAAAAAVVLVLGGAVVVRQNLTPPTGLPAPAATTTGHAETAEAIALTEDIRIWAAAIEAIIAREPGSTTYYVLDAPLQNGSTAARGKPFTDAQKTAITGLLASKAKLEWIAKRPPLADPCAPNAGGPFVTVGAIVRRAGHVEVDASIWRGCLAARWLTFRLDEKAGTWNVTGTVGPEAVS